MKGCVLTAVLVAGALIGTTACAAVRPGENFVDNGTFEIDQEVLPPEWGIFPLTVKPPECLPNGGPGGKPALRLTAGKDEMIADWRIFQSGYGFAHGGTFRLRGWVRTKDVGEEAQISLMSINGGWSWSSHREMPKIPRDTGGKWQKIEYTFKAGGPEGRLYHCIIHVTKFTGTLEVADVSIEAVDELALSGSAPRKRDSGRPRIVAWRPLLGEVPRWDRSVAFRVVGGGIGKDEAGDYDLVFNAGKGERTKRVEREETVFTIPDDAADSGMLSLRLRRRDTGSNLVERVFRYRIADVPKPGFDAKYRRLNNFVTEVYSGTACGADRRFGLGTREWIFAAVRTKAAGIRVLIDGREVIGAGTPRHETVRELDAGWHDLKVVGAEEGDRLVLRIIPELINYCPCLNRYAEVRPYDWRFQERYSLPAITTELGGTIPDDILAGLKARGYKWVKDFRTIKLKSGDDLCERMDKAPAMQDPRYDGAACDEEYFASNDQIVFFQEGLQKYDVTRCPTNKIFTYVTGKPRDGVVGLDFLSTAVNVSESRGKVIAETYCRTKGTEAEARGYIDGFIRQFHLVCRRTFPAGKRSYVASLGNFNQMPIISQVHHPEVDYKYFLDLQMNLMATAGDLDGIGGVAYWGTYYGDEELVKWSFRLFRHYCILGRTEMLSERFGLKYRPELVANGDFRGGLDGWKAVGSVTTGVRAGLGDKVEMRWGHNGGLGDTYAELVRQESAANVLMQESGELIPGRTYRLQFVTFDVKAVEASLKKLPKALHGVSADLGTGAEVDPELTYVINDKGINLHHIVFTAKNRRVRICISDEGAKVGAHTGINFVSLLPYVK